MPCPPPATCWTCCSKKTRAQAPDQLPLVQGLREQDPRVRAPVPTAAAPLAPAAPVSRFKSLVPFKKKNKKNILFSAVDGILFSLMVSIRDAEFWGTLTFNLVDRDMTVISKVR